MKSRTEFFACLLIFSFSSCVILKKSPKVKNSTYFPKYFSNDYFPKQYTARVVFPTDKKQNIWVKGSKKFNKVRLEGSDSITNLHAPYYTSLLNSNKDSVTVEFLEGNQRRKSQHTIKVYPLKEKAISNTSDFSFLIYGCFQPFEVSDESDSNIVFASSNLEYEFRKTLEKVSHQLPFEYHSNFVDDFSLIDNLTKKELSQTPSQRNTLLSTPILLLGTGDQVYVDAAYYTEASINPISAWETGKNPQPLLKIDDYVDHLNKMYLHFWSFKSLENITSRIPQISAIDDHEIRDGWGSQGDEYISKENGYEYLNPELKPFFFAARDAFYKHQLATGPVPKNYSNEKTEGDFHLEFESNGIPIFVFDLRSHRNTHANITISSPQMDDFKRWLNNVKTGQEIILVSSIPFFWEIPFLFRQSIKLKPEIRDELVDFWSSNSNEKQRNEIFQLLIKARLDKNIKPYILSGDVHIGALNKIWFSEQKESGKKKNKLLAYEIIISGFAHKELAEQTFASQLGKMANNENKKIVSDLKVEGYDNSIFSVEGDMVFSAAKLNFGAFEKNNSTTFLNIFFKDEEKTVQIKMPSQWNESGDRIHNVDNPLHVFSDDSTKTKVILLKH